MARTTGREPIRRREKSAYDTEVSVTALFAQLKTMWDRFFRNLVRQSGLRPYYLLPNYVLPTNRAVPPATPGSVPSGLRCSLGTACANAPPGTSRGGASRTTFCGFAAVSDLEVLDLSDVCGGASRSSCCGFAAVSDLEVLDLSDVYTRRGVRCSVRGRPRPRWAA